MRRATGRRPMKLLFSSVLAAAVAVPALAATNPYPTTAIADYVFACMAVNGQSRQALESCSCSIDVVSSILPFEDYEAAEVVLSMRRVRGGGEKMALFRETAQARDAVETLKRAQVEAEVRCF